MRTSTILFLMFLVWPVSVHSESIRQMDAPSMMISTMMQEIPQIKEPRWRNNAYRDLAESMAFYYDDVTDAINIVKKIDNSDTQAITIRAIAMALAIHKNFSDERYKQMFNQLDDAAQIIKDEGARDIAYTYIAMAQAFAGLDADATKTTDAMKNPALKHKAFGETAEIQAERGDYDAAMNSVNLINSTAFKNKALSLISDIFVKRDELDKAYKTAMQITNPTKKSSSLQKIINAKIGLDEVEK